MKDMDKISEQDLELLIKARKARRRKRKMKSGKKALFLAFGICTVLLIFTMGMIYLQRDTTSLSILATASVGILPIMYGIYDHSQTKINLKHMDENYDPNYDENHNLY